MLDAKGLEAGAREEARWDGRDFDALGSADRSRYLGRFADGVTAYLQAVGPEPVAQFSDEIADAVREAYRRKIAEYARDFRDPAMSGEPWKTKYGTNLHSTSLGEQWAMSQALYSALVATPPAEPDFAASIAETITEECAAGAACGWRSCTGCHETNEGAETGHYPYSKMFGCHVGSGCSECGGLGVVWEHWSEDSLNEMAADVSAPTPPAERVVEARKRLERAGGAMSNILYNMKQDPTFAEALRDRIAECQEEWDAALAAKDGRS